MGQEKRDMKDGQVEVPQQDLYQEIQGKSRMDKNAIRQQILLRTIAEQPFARGELRSILRKWFISCYPGLGPPAEGFRPFPIEWKPHVDEAMGRREPGKPAKPKKPEPQQVVELLELAAAGIARMERKKNITRESYADLMSRALDRVFEDVGRSQTPAEREKLSILRREIITFGSTSERIARNPKTAQPKPEQKEE